VPWKILLLGDENETQPAPCKQHIATILKQQLAASKLATTIAANEQQISGSADMSLTNVASVVLSVPPAQEGVFPLRAGVLNTTETLERDLANTEPATAALPPGIPRYTPSAEEIEAAAAALAAFKEKATKHLALSEAHQRALEKQKKTIAQLRREQKEILKELRDAKARKEQQDAHRIVRSFAASNLRIQARAESGQVFTSTRALLLLLSSITGITGEGRRSNFMTWRLKLMERYALLGNNSQCYKVRGKWVRFRGFEVSNLVKSLTVMNEDLNMAGMKINISETRTGASLTPMARTGERELRNGAREAVFSRVPRFTIMAASRRELNGTAYAVVERFQNATIVISDSDIEGEHDNSHSEGEHDNSHSEGEDDNSHSEGEQTKKEKPQKHKPKELEKPKIEEHVLGNIRALRVVKPSGVEAPHPDVDQNNPWGRLEARKLNFSGILNRSRASAGASIAVEAENETFALDMGDNDVQPAEHQTPSRINPELVRRISKRLSMGAGNASDSVMVSRTEVLRNSQRVLLAAGASAESGRAALEDERADNSELSAAGDGASSVCPPADASAAGDESGEGAGSPSATNEAMEPVSRSVIVRLNINSFIRNTYDILQAKSLLNIKPNKFRLTPEELKIIYKTAMRTLHPDKVDPPYADGAAEAEGIKKLNDIGDACKLLSKYNDNIQHCWYRIPDHTKEQGDRKTQYTKLLNTQEVIAWCDEHDLDEHAINYARYNAEMREDQWSTSQDMCLCKRGYRQDDPNTCVACVGGTYTYVLDAMQCEECPADTYTPSDVFPWDAPNDCQACAVCNKSTSSAFTDHYDAALEGQGCGLDQPSSCPAAGQLPAGHASPAGHACPAGASLFLPTTASHRNKGVSSCVCDANFYGLIGTACTACPAGQVRPDFLNAGTTLADCLCAAGFEPDPAAANLCRQCPLGTYKPYTGDHNCTASPATLTTAQTGNTNASACACAPGFIFDGDKCTVCPENTHKTGFNLNTTCSACTANSFGPVGGTEALDCTCFAGFNAVEPYAGLCNPCSTGKYKNETANIGKTMIAIDAATKQVNLA
jgi:hypothetical protein